MFSCESIPRSLLGSVIRRAKLSRLTRRRSCFEPFQNAIEVTIRIDPTDWPNSLMLSSDFRKETTNSVVQGGDTLIRLSSRFQKMSIFQHGLARLLGGGRRFQCRSQTRVILSINGHHLLSSMHADQPLSSESRTVPFPFFGDGGRHTDAMTDSPHRQQEIATVLRRRMLRNGGAITSRSL